MLTPRYMCPLCKQARMLAHMLAGSACLCVCANMCRHGSLCVCVCVCACVCHSDWLPTSIILSGHPILQPMGDSVNWRCFVSRHCVCGLRMQLSAFGTTVNHIAWPIVRMPLPCAFGDVTVMCEMRYTTCGVCVCVISCVSRVRAHAYPCQVSAGCLPDQALSHIPD